MNIYIFELIENLTDRYHSEGGAVVIAQDKERAIELLEKEGTILTEEERNNCKEYGITADAEKVFIFPDAGCC